MGPDRKILGSTRDPRVEVGDPPTGSTADSKRVNGGSPFTARESRALPGQHFDRDQKRRLQRRGFRA